MDLISIYAFTMLASMVLAGGLALLGTQLAMRDKAAQTLCISQGAMIGVLLGIALAHNDSSESAWWQSALPFSLAAVIAAVCFYLSDRVLEIKKASQNTGLMAFFVFLLALANLILAFFPGVESHMSQRFFGDLATTSLVENYIILTSGIILMIVFVVFRRPISKYGFDAAVFGKQTKDHKMALMLNTLTITMVATSVQTAGLLFTITMLFMPTTILSYAKKPGITRHYVLCCLVAMMSCALGFYVSLFYLFLPTVPTIVATTAVLGFAVKHINVRGH